MQLDERPGVSGQSVSQGGYREYPPRDRRTQTRSDAVELVTGERVMLVAVRYSGK